MFSDQFFKVQFPGAWKRSPLIAAIYRQKGIRYRIIFTYVPNIILFRIVIDYLKNI
jgi:hypothetical protein